MNIKYLHVTGMTCHNCETAIIKVLKEIETIKTYDVDYVTGIVTIEYLSPSFDINECISIISNKAGYNCKEISKTRKNINNILPVLIGGAVVILLYYFVNKSGVINNIPEIKDSMSYPILFIVGLLTSIHCVGMCGGINLSQTCSVSNNDKNKVLKRGLKYNLGRLISYTIIGGIVGGIGSIFTMAVTLQGIIIIIAGIIMIIMGLNMIGLFSFLKRFVPVLPNSINLKLNKMTNSKRPFIVGLINGLMPCGPLQSMQLFALSTGSILKGALSMFLFSAGTIPLMLIFGTLSTLFSKKLQKNILKISAFLILILGISMISRGLNLNGVSITKQTETEVKINAALAKVEGDKQFVVSDVSPSGYEPIIVQVGIPVLWSLDAGQGDITGCNNAIIVREFGIKQNLKVGQTLVEFTPETTGNFSFSCWMGMIRSNILVVDDLKSFDTELLNSPSEKAEKEVEIQIPEYTLKNIGYSSVKDDQQKSEMIIDLNGFKPSILVMQKNIKTNWTFITNEINEKNSRLSFPIYKAHLDFIQGVDKTIDLTPTSDMYFYSVEGDFLGFVIIVDDINIIDKNEILTRVKSYIK